MKKVTTTLLLFYCCIFLFAQNADEQVDSILDATETVVESVEAVDYSEEKVYEKDSINYDMNINYAEKRDFKENLNEKYNGKEFTYIEEEKKEKEKPKKDKDTAEIDPNSAKKMKQIAQFIGNAFPYLIGILAILIILKSVLGSDVNFFNFGKNKRIRNEKLIYEDDENIEDTDFNKLIELAINDKNYRLATRYYYLSALQKMTKKQLIDYHKDKTNTDYQFELENKTIRSKYSYISYIYNYVWYGEFEVNEDKFNTIQHHFESFINLV